MIHYLQGKEKARSRKLWEEAFPEDSQAFRDYYYTEKTKDNEILVLEEQGKVLSMLHRNPYDLALGKQTAKCDYIVGVATDKEHRRKGYMRQLMERALKDMNAEKMPFCFLMPAFEALYLPFDFTYIYKKQNRVLTDKGLSAFKSREATHGELKEAAAYMNQWLAKRYEVYAKRDFAYMARLKKELESENGCMELLYSENTLAGIKARWGMEKPEERMLFCEESYARNTGEAVPCIMGRIVNFAEFVRFIRLQKGVKAGHDTILLELQDDILQENAGLWRWTLTQDASAAEKISGTAVGKNGEKAEPDIRLTVLELTAWLLGYALPGAAEKWAHVVRPLTGVFLDEIV